MNRIIAGIGVVVVMGLTGYFLFFEEQDLFSSASDNGVEMEALSLQVPLEDTVEERAQFREEFVEREGFILRDLYEKWIGLLGANGIIKEVEGVYPNCHDRGHDLGKVIYTEVQNIGESLRVCDNACFSGCMHGVMMEAFSMDATVETNPEPHTHEDGEDEHVLIEDVHEKMKEMCEDEVFDEGNQYSPGDCAHGVGHALMFISNYQIDQAMEQCSYFDSDIMDYYCATGAYMEYVTQDEGILDDPEHPLDFSPCDTAGYPAACFRYKLPRSMYYHYKAGGTFAEFYAACQELEGNVRLGCMHGFGNAHVQFLVREEMSLADLCLRGSGEEQYVCIEGAMERIGRYHADLAPEICAGLPDGWQKELCNQSIENELYSMEKPFELYLR
jgi:hypothetical protein